MRRSLAVLVLFVAVAIALEPVIHTHPLTQSVNAQCAVCVNAHAQVTSLAPAPAAPLVAIGNVERPAAIFAVVPAVNAIPSRAPPVA